MNEHLFEDLTNLIINKVVEGVSSKLPEVVTKAIKETREDRLVRKVDIFSEPGKRGLWSSRKGKTYRDLKDAEEKGLITPIIRNGSKFYSRNEILNLNIKETA